MIHRRSPLLTPAAAHPIAQPPSAAVASGLVDPCGRGASPARGLSRLQALRPRPIQVVPPGASPGSADGLIDERATWLMPLGDGACPGSPLASCASSRSTSGASHSPSPATSSQTVIRAGGDESPWGIGFARLPMPASMSVSDPGF